MKRDQTEPAQVIPEIIEEEKPLIKDETLAETLIEEPKLFTNEVAAKKGACKIFFTWVTPIIDFARR